MHTRWKKSFKVAAVCMAVGIVLMAASFFATGCDINKMSFVLVSDDGTGLIDVGASPDAPTAPAAPLAP